MVCPEPASDLLQRVRARGIRGLDPAQGACPGTGAAQRSRASADQRGGGPDPADLSAFGQAARKLLDDPAETGRLGLAAHAYVRENYLGDIHLMRYASLLSALISGA